MALRKGRESLGISQEGFAPKAGMHRTYYSAIERGKKDIQVGTLERICHAMGARMADILNDAEK